MCEERPHSESYAVKMYLLKNRCDNYVGHKAQLSFGHPIL